MTTTIAITIPVSHPRRDEIIRLAADEALPSAGEHDHAPLIVPSGPLTRLLTADLNDGEIAFLRELAEHSPEVVPFTRLLELAGSPQKLGNITSGLYRRWTARGGLVENAPWVEEKGEGRCLPEDVAELVLEHLGETR